LEKKKFLTVQNAISLKLNIDNIVRQAKSKRNRAKSPEAQIIIMTQFKIRIYYVMEKSPLLPTHHVSCVVRICSDISKIYNEHVSFTFLPRLNVLGERKKRKSVIEHTLTLSKKK
jgi:hypothetical protein